MCPSPAVFSLGFIFLASSRFTEKNEKVIQRDPIVTHQVSTLLTSCISVVQYSNQCNDTDKYYLLKSIVYSNCFSFHLIVLFLFQIPFSTQHITCSCQASLSPSWQNRVAHFLSPSMNLKVRGVLVRYVAGLPSVSICLMFYLWFDWTIGLGAEDHRN